jgi:aryl-alcohol dehydrogenase-like predicted oxidoreductase
MAGKDQPSSRVVLGASALSVSPVCFGTWQLSPRFWGELPKKEILRAMDKALELGINFYDTADAYGDGYAETVLGEFMKGKPRDRVVACTKVFNHFQPDGTRYPDLSPEYIRQRCDIELRRLGIDCIDLYLLHMYDPLTPLADCTGFLEVLKKEGKIREYGVSNFTIEQLKAARRYGRYNVMQPPYSLIAADIEAGLLPYCQSENVGVMVYSPMHKGLLTGKYEGHESFTDFRKNHPDFQGERFRHIALAVQELKPLARKYEMSIYQLVLSATLMHPAIQVAVVGIKNSGQIEDAARVMGKTLSREDYFTVRRTLSIEGMPKIKDARGEKK